MNTQRPDPKTLVIGIDGGGTNTIVWLAELDRASTDGNPRVLGIGSAGPSNQRAVGPMMATGNLDAAIESAFAAAALPRATVAAACLGLAGADRDSDRRVIQDWAGAARVATRVAVVNDAIPLLHVDRGSGSGVALIAGTGSLAWGRNDSGQTARAGGWGYLFGDEGSAFSIGRAVLAAVSQAIDGRGERTSLTDEVLCSLEIASPQEIIAAVYASEVPRAVVAQMASLAFLAAAQGDQTANAILQQAAEDLAAMAVVTARGLKLLPVPLLSMTGAVLIHNPEFQRQVTRKIEAAEIEVSSTIVAVNPVAGAVNIACQLAAE